MTVLRSQLLNWLEAWAAARSSRDRLAGFPATNSHVDRFDRKALFAKRICRSDVAGWWFAASVVSPTSTMKVGRVSCSSSSTMPTEPRRRSGSLLSRPSGEAAGARLERSELLPLVVVVVATGGGPGGLNPAKVPLASVTVLMPLSSRVLLSILAAASELEKRAGRKGRMRRECEKNSGDGGWPSPCSWCWRAKPKWSSECRVRLTRRRFSRGSVEGAVLCGSWEGSPWRFLPATAGGVFSSRSLLVARGRVGAVLGSSLLGTRGNGHCVHGVWGEGSGSAECRKRSSSGVEGVWWW